MVYDALNRQTIKDSGFYLGIAFLVMGVLLWLALRRWRAVAIALVPPVIVSVMTTGLFVLTGRPFTQVTSILPMLVLVIGLSDAIHLITHYYAERRGARRHGHGGAAGDGGAHRGVGGDAQPVHGAHDGGGVRGPGQLADAGHPRPGAVRRPSACSSCG